MRIYSNRNAIVEIYLLTGDAFRVRWDHDQSRSARSGRESYTVALDVRKGHRGRWKEVFTSYFSLGACMGELDLYACAVGAAAYPGSDDDGKELPHPGERFPGILDAMACAESDLLEKAAKR